MPLRDPVAVQSQIHGTPNIRPERDRSTRSESRKQQPVAALSSFVRDTINWAGETLQSCQDGLSKEERQQKRRDEDRKQVLYLKMRNATTYDEWRACASELDELEGNNVWKQTAESDEYDYRLVHERMKQLEEARISCDVNRMLFLVRTALSRDMGNMSDGRLYRHAHLGTKDLIDRYITVALETISTLVQLASKEGNDLVEMQHALDELLSARQAFGRSAVLFSGGATFGMNHIGVVKALHEAKLMPRIVSGASAGSIVAAVFCTHTDDELPAVLERFPYGDLDVFDPAGQKPPPLERITRLLKYGSIYDIRHLERAIRGWMGDMTFQEAYNRTRRILNICISSAGLYELPRLLNYITAPNVLIWSAVCVSCSVPVVFSPSQLRAKDPLTGEIVPWHDDGHHFIDGSVDGDVPTTRLAEMFNVNHFIVSQVNPHVVPFLSKDEGPGEDPGRRSWLASPWLQAMTSFARDEMLHRMAVMSEMGIFSNTFTKMSSILSQKYSGDINIFPDISYAHLSRILQNPTAEFMHQACLSGERATWPKIARIRNHVAIELALDRAVQTMRARVALSPTVQAGLGIHMGETPWQPNWETSRVPHRRTRRRGSYGQEPERGRPGRLSSSRRPSMQLRRARSTLFMECAHPERPVSPVPPTETPCAAVK
ncbi:hypothetical protein VTN31DRAFT_2981 [Thermomyces dupontii]|uniref:uncharacterized protein n=1 Tax=Talaromyces thermophilus TaxID=28565 RepID=UPI0037443DD3